MEATTMTRPRSLELLAPAGEGRVRVTVLLDCQGTALSASMDI